MRGGRLFLYGGSIQYVLEWENLVCVCARALSNAHINVLCMNVSLPGIIKTQGGHILEKEV